jgi:proline iminopeptidase
MSTRSAVAPRPAEPVTGPMALMWSDRRLGLAVAAVLAVLAGLVVASLTPRGPVSAGDALLWMAVALAIGLLAGFVAGSRWSLLLVPVALLAAFELGRMGTPGPTVDAPHVGSMYGIIALVVGRGTTWLLAVPPLLLGARWGVELAARLGRPGTARMGLVGWSASGLVALAVVGLAVSVARPASTAPIAGADGQPVPGSVAELTSVSLGGHDQALMIRGRSVDAPVLLHLAGGPGGTDIGAMRADTGLESHFVVVTWDQRGTGKSYAALDPVGTLTVDQMVSDLIELTEHLRERFDEERIYLHGQSWGSLLGVLAVEQRPDLYHAWVGSGQMVSPRGTDVLFWEDTIAWAETTGQPDLAATLRANGPPPYEDVLRYEIALSHEHDWNPYPDFDNERELPFTLLVPENDLMDQVNGLRAFLDTFAALYPQLQGIDFRADVRRLEVPVYVIAGAHEARGRAVLAEEWFALLEAPSKAWFVFERSGHRPTFEEPARFVEVMSRVLDETYPARQVALAVAGPAGAAGR